MSGIGIGLGTPFVRGAGLPYADKVLNAQPSDLLAYFMLDEQTGTVAVNSEGTAARNGTWQRDISVMGTVPGIGDGNSAPSLDGSSDYCSINTASLEGVMDYDEITVLLWASLIPDTLWPTVNTYHAIGLLTDSSSSVGIFKGANNRLAVLAHQAGGLAETINHVHGTGVTGWHSYGVTASLGLDETRAFVDGLQSGATQTGLGIDGGLGFNALSGIIGAFLSVGGQKWSGGLAHVGIWKAALAPSVMGDLGVV